MGHFSFFAVIAIQKKPADSHCQTRLHYVRGMIQEMDGGVWLLRTMVRFYLNHLESF